MNDIEIMKALFKAFSGGETICVELKDGSTQPGTISSLDGEQIMIAGQEIALSRIGINYYSDTSEVEEEGILFDICEDRIVLITDTEKKVIFLKDITEVTQIHDDEILGYESTSDEYKVTAFEQAVIAGEKSVVDGYLTGEDVLGIPKKRRTEYYPYREIQFPGMMMIRTELIIKPGEFTPMSVTVEESQRNCLFKVFLNQHCHLS